MSPECRQQLVSLFRQYYRPPAIRRTDLCRPRHTTTTTETSPQARLRIGFHPVRRWQLTRRITTPFLHRHRYPIELSMMQTLAIKSAGVSGRFNKFAPTDTAVTWRQHSLQGAHPQKHEVDTKLRKMSWRDRWESRKCSWLQTESPASASW